jgi:peptide/nickel transport system substrate-binding protein
MSEANYWERFTGARITRRRVTRGGAVIGGSIVALGLIGCSAGDGNKASSGDKSGLVSKPVDTTAQAKKGGVLKHFGTADPLHFDPLFSSNANAGAVVAPYAYPRLLKWVLGKYPSVADGSAEGYAAESFEISPDKLQITFKLRQGMKWDSRTPTSGRSLDAGDVVFSWNKFAQLNQLRTNLVYNATTAPLAPVESLSSPDDRTIVLKLRGPDSRLVPLLAAYDYLNIMPKESEKDFDPRKDVRGHGPWLMEEYTPSVRIVWRKNPDFYLKDRPFPDRVEMPVIPDYSQRLSQFKAGSIFTSVATLEDIVQAKKDVPQTLMREGEFFRTAGGNYVTFGLEGNAREAPFKDVRLRQAMSMSVDREGYANVIENRDGFKKDGIELPVKFNAIVYAGWTGAYLDPDDEKEFGSNHKYLKMNITEAKKLISAAGYPNGLDFDFIYSTTQYGAEYLKSVEVLAGMFEGAGLRAKQVPLPYNEYQQKTSEETYWRFGGAVHRAGRGFPSLGSTLFAYMNPNGSNYHGATPDGQNAEKGDPKLTDLVQKIIQEFDLGRQNALAHELVRYYTGQTYSIQRPSNSKGYTLTWPAIGNYGLNSTHVGGASTDPWLNWWIDDSKPPLGKT